MPVEVTVVMRFDHPHDVPSEDDIENAFDCIVLAVEEEEV